MGGANLGGNRPFCQGKTGGFTHDDKTKAAILKAHANIIPLGNGLSIDLIGNKTMIGRGFMQGVIGVIKNHVGQLAMWSKSPETEEKWMKKYNELSNISQ
jgi:hypothetical protein